MESHNFRVHDWCVYKEYLHILADQKSEIFKIKLINFGFLFLKNMKKSIYIHNLTGKNLCVIHS